MNKDVVYIEPEEDITDIISKIEGSKSKIVALVPPKKAGVFKSIVNIKLIMKTSSNADKNVVLVTTDPAIIKLAAATKMPVTKDLKSAPAIPEPEDAEKLDDTEEVDVDDEAEEEEPEKEEKKEEKEEENDEEEKDDDSDEDDEKPADKKEDKEEEKEEKSDKSKKAGNKLANSNNPVLKWIGTHQKLSIGIGAGFLVFVIFMIWAFAIAPAVTITLKLETVTGNFSEGVSFTDKLSDENVTEGKFYIEEKKIEDKTEIEFEATGKKNVGDKASGTVIVYAFFKDEGTFLVKAGTVFAHNGLKFSSTEPATLGWDGKDTSKCDNKNNATSLIKSGCQISARIKVQAADSGANYNIGAASSGWSVPSGISGVYSDAAMAGGTDKNIIIVQQSDIDKAITDMTSGSNNDKAETAKQKLLDEIKDGQFPIESSFKFEASDPTPSPKVGEEVKEGEKAKLTVTTTATMFVMDETKLKEFISEKAKLEKGFKIYEMKDPFVENFLKTDAGYVGRLKTSYVAGSTITENEVVDVVKGKGIGTAKRDLTDNFSGIKSIDITTSMPWVTSVPGNPEKITVIINTDGDKNSDKKE